MPRRKRQPNLYEREGIWYARLLRPEGGRVRVSTGLTDRAAAAEWLARQERDLQATASGRSPEAERHTVGEALSHYVDVTCATKAPRTREMYDFAARTVSAVLGQIRVNALTREDVQRYLSRRVADGYARSTILKERITLKAALEEAARRKLLIGSAAALVPEFSFRYVPRRVFLPREALPVLLAHLEPERRAFVLVAVFGGLGHAELEALTWPDDKGTHLRVPGTKTAERDRMIPINAELRAALDAIPGEHSGPVLVPWMNVNRDLRRACERAGIGRVTCHDLRRSFGSWLAQANVSTKAIGTLLGHAPGSTMADRTYSVLNDASLTEAVGRLAAEPCVSGVSSADPKRSETGTKRHTDEPANRAPDKEKAP